MVSGEMSLIYTLFLRIRTTGEVLTGWRDGSDGAPGDAKEIQRNLNLTKATCKVYIKTYLIHTTVSKL